MKSEELTARRQQEQASKHEPDWPLPGIRGNRPQRESRWRATLASWLRAGRPTQVDG